MRLLALSPVLLVLGCATASADVTPMPQLAANAGVACQQMGLDPSQAQFQDCVRTLVRSSRVASERSAVVASRAQCEAQGGQPGTSQFANCVLDTEERAGF